jgi:hypothetical protein
MAKKLRSRHAAVFCGIDTSTCVETSLREAFNIGYDVGLISDATASSNHKHYESTLENIALTVEQALTVQPTMAHLGCQAAVFEVDRKAISLCCVETIRSQHCRYKIVELPITAE